MMVDGMGSTKDQERIGLHCSSRKFRPGPAHHIRCFLLTVDIKQKYNGLDSRYIRRLADLMHVPVVQ